MSGITTGTGLFSGIDTKSLIEQLLAIDARPKQLAARRITELQRQQAAYLGVNSALLALKTAAGNFESKKVFDTNKATSSDADVLTATAGTTASEGTYNFVVNRLVTTQQVLSRGFTDSTSSGVGATEFTFEVGGGGLASETSLSDLNGGVGISRGKFVIAETGGGTATIDLSTASTVTDVLDAINSASGISVRATVDGDRLKLTQANGLAFSVTNSAGADTATDLGIAGASTGATLTGTRVRTISGQTSLASLNDGAGVMIRDGAASLTITDRAGVVVNVDLGEIKNTSGTPPVTTVTQARATTLNDVVTLINAKATTAGAGVTASIDQTNNRLVLTDTSGGGGNLIVVDGANGRTTATDLGIATGASGVAASAVNGKRLVAGLNSSLVSNLAGGSGVSASAISFTNRAGVNASLTIGASALAGSIDDVVADLNSQLAAANGGLGLGITVALNRAGNGLSVTDASGGSGNLVISGAAADALGIAAAADADGKVNGTNLQTKWVSLATKLEDLNAGKGIGTGEFRVTNSAGATKLFKVTSSQKTVDDLIQFINAQGLNGVTAKLNSQGDGIVIEDTSNGSGKLTIADTSGTVARSLNLVGEQAVVAGVARADGSYERSVTFAATDTLQSVANKIKSASVGVSATIINDGGSGTPYRLSFTSQTSGRVGRAIIDTGDLDMNFQTLSKGEDARVFFGSTDPATAVLLTSSSNVLDNVVQGVSIDLNATSTEAVEVVVSRNTEAMEKSIEDFVKAFNGVFESIDKYDTYDQDSNTRGVLLGDTTASNVRQTLLRAVQSKPTGVDGEYQFLFQVGVRIGAGAKLEFDREKFRTALAADPEGVKALFAAKELIPNERIEIRPGVTVADTTDDYSKLGVAEQIRRLADGMTNSVDGLLTQRNKGIDTQIKLQNQRIDNIDVQLTTKRQKLEAQFLAMEKAIASLQQQSGALNGLSNLG